ncbi:NAD(P)/FAD-dependent oxidoreductase [Lutimaribacter sp. EGI FJ00015]|uniref:NAD(P)/FAD-dependent oxidoreductase n=1 Tax=Lutimaribacter degradans TaxID=2945989 RepID=A0ACC5ZYK6_9RHOB|nr:FAD/NAD(P)-binding oxidoreductase [Lutimaribacter sp. EGI FJ00013]MCM2563426.1 NAD(P)/FAD-dependent oxidoreductase [Lutimaribacter sp. EGI FJ00013]MCO0614606.1 NAD(P)/FAD-dependent oxidoreductase [Lutimaribacter sp. EGI FJ00015]MCO0637277.1 NAD(P)/FAD-dependent oxidoreductase [Lutimaribacter sp. EGI FJ00014]
MTLNPFQPTRRGFLGLAGGAAVLAAGTGPARAQKVSTKAKIVILGAGAGGTALANRLVERLDGAQITIVDGRAQHWYQPGFTLIAAGLKPADYSVSQTAEWLPDGVKLVAEYAAEIDPETNTLTTASGNKLSYDYLVTAPGLTLNWEGIEGFSLDLVGKDGIGAVYAGPEYAAKTWAAMDQFTDTGGQALFTRPATEMKCAGAPLKYTFLTDDYARRKGNRGKVEITYAAHSKSLFSVPIVNEKVRMLFADRGFDVVHDHVMKAIDPGKKLATFSTPEGDVELPYDFTNVIPPMIAPEVIRNSPLPWQEGNWKDEGWVDVDMYNLRHKRYANVFALGDVAGVPKGKTAASVKWQVPVVEDHLVAQIAGDTTDTSYNGYTSCPLITRVGRAMLVEFDYNNDLTPSFPGVIAPLEELWISWLMKEVALKATYNAMLRGKA